MSLSPALQAGGRQSPLPPPPLCPLLPPPPPQFSHSPRNTHVLESPRQPGLGGACVCVGSFLQAGSLQGGGFLQGGGLPHCLCSLQTLPSPLTFLCGSSRACQKNALDGARERAGRACVCARLCAPVLPLTSLKQAVPELQRRRQPLISWPRLLREAGVAFESSCPGSQRAEHPCRRRCLPGGSARHPCPLPPGASGWVAGLLRAAEDGAGRRELDTWLQLGWTTLQPVPLASPPLRWVLYQIASSFATGVDGRTWIPAFFPARQAVPGLALLGKGGG